MKKLYIYRKVKRVLLGLICIVLMLSKGLPTDWGGIEFLASSNQLVLFISRLLHELRNFGNNIFLPLSM